MSQSTTNPTWIDMGANLGFRGERPATNRLSHGKALVTAIDNDSQLPDSSAHLKVMSHVSQAVSVTCCYVLSLRATPLYVVTLVW
jgi:hypothetical protein